MRICNAAFVSERCPRSICDSLCIVCDWPTSVGVYLLRLRLSVYRLRFITRVMIINVLIISLKLKYKFTTTHNVDHRSLISLLEFQQFVFGFSEEFIFFDAVRADAISIESRCTVAVCPASNFQALIRSE